METKEIEMNIADAIMEKPIGFSIGNRHFCLYPVTLGKIYLLSRLMKTIGFNQEILKANPFMEALRVCREHTGAVCRMLAYCMMRRKEDVFNERKVQALANMLADRLDGDELSRLLLMAISWDDAETYVKHFGLDRERVLRQRIRKLKESGGSISFGGLSTYGTLIDFACQRYGWTMDYVVWGISYVNLQMLMADAITSVLLSKEEQRKLRIPQDTTFINADDMANMQKIMSMDWD